MKIAVRSKSGAKEFKCDVPWAAISISTYEDDLPVLSTENRVALLQLAFRDTDFEQQERAFNKDLAKKVIVFAESVIDRVETLLVHCEMGLCRSPGVAAALAKLYAGTDQYYFDHYVPNMLVYRKIIEAAVEHDEKFARVFDRVE